MLLVEPWVYQRVRQVVVPSHGLARELTHNFPCVAGKIRVLANPVDLEKLNRPAEFDRAGFRANLGFCAGDVVLAFAALGQFERKGLPLLLEALARMPGVPLKLNVIGGRDDLIASYRRKIEAMGLGGRVVFSGMQRDIRPYLWSADAFVLPSAYEVFPLVALEASAAGLPLLSTPLNGVEEFLRDGQNGFLIERSVEGIKTGLGRFLAVCVEERHAIGRQGQHDVSRYSTDAFTANWRSIWDELAAAGSPSARCRTPRRWPGPRRGF